MCLCSSLQAQEIPASYLSKVRIEYGLPSISYFWSSKGNEKYNESIGIRKLGHEQLVSSHDTHHLGSCTKSMTALLSAILVDKKIINWNDKVSKYLPTAFKKTEYSRVTLEMLLAHRAGLQKSVNKKLHTFFEDTSVDGQEQRKIFIKQLSDYTNQKIGQFHYSNLGYVLLGHILEKATGLKFTQLVKSYLFEPLEMSSCGFGETSSLGNVQSKWGHFYSKGKLKSYHYDFPKLYEPAASIHCNFQDWNKFLKVTMNGYNKKSNFLSQESFKKLYSTYNHQEFGYTFGGWELKKVDGFKGAVLTHHGYNQLNYAEVFIEPSSENIYAFATNAYHNAAQAVDQLIVYIHQVRKK